MTTGAQIAVPVLEGPIPVTAASHPFNGAAWSKVPVDLAAHGYVQEEYLVSGRAGIYEWVPGSDYEVELLRDGEYVTRLLVTRPADPARFSGKAVLDIVNMSAGYDWQAIWAALWECILESGDAFVGVTSKPNVFPGMCRFDPARYGRLAMANPLPPDEQACGKLPGEPDHDPNLFGVSKLDENGLCWDLFTQLGALLKSDDRGNPLSRPATRLIMTGESQSGMYLTTYFRWFHRRATLPDGRPIFDAYLAEDGGTSTTRVLPLNQCGGVTAPLPPDDPQRRIPGRGAPLFVLHSEWGYPARDRPPHWGRSERKPDVSTDGDKFAMWELAGACHGWTWQYDYGDASAADLAAIGLGHAGFQCSPLQPEINLYMAEKAAYGLLDRWLDDGVPPPSAPTIETEAGEPIRDEHGNAVGGLRLPEIQVPIAAYTGLYAPGPDATDAITPFDRGLLRRLYPTHGDYARRFEAAAADLVDGGFLLPEDADKLVAAALVRDVP
jgi:hypothetical protein